MYFIGQYLIYMTVALGLFGLGVTIYIRVTPYGEISLIRAGNTAAAWSLGGMMVGLALPLASAMAHSISLVDMALWSAVAVAFQLLAYFAASLTLHDIRAGIEADRTAYGVALGALSVAMGILNAGALTY
jgi:putative membrane protein